MEFVENNMLLIGLFVCGWCGFSVIAVLFTPMFSARLSARRKGNWEDRQ